MGQWRMRWASDGWDGQVTDKMGKWRIKWFWYSSNIRRPMTMPGGPGLPSAKNHFFLRTWNVVEGQDGLVPLDSIFGMRRHSNYVSWYIFWCHQVELNGDFVFVFLSNVWETSGLAFHSLWHRHACNLHTSGTTTQNNNKEQQQRKTTENNNENNNRK